jgi:hypothetical protein
MRILAAVFLCMTSAAWGTAIYGSTVTGTLEASSPTNYYDPANLYVPATGYLNSPSNFNSPTVIINSTTPTFGYADNTQTIVSDFSNGTELVLTNNLFSPGTEFPLALTFTDTAFIGITLVSNNFPGLTFGISGDVITINIPSREVAPGDEFTGIFNVQTSTPEPSGFVMMAAGSLALIFLRGKKALNRVR